MIITNPCPIFSILVYFLVGSPILTISPNEEKKGERGERGKKRDREREIGMIDFTLKVVN